MRATYINEHHFSKELSYKPKQEQQEASLKVIIRRVLGFRVLPL
jgi:hypothetical protein